MKRILAVLVVFCMMLGVIPAVTVSAATRVSTFSDLSNAVAANGDDLIIIEASFEFTVLRQICLHPDLRVPS